MYATKGLIFWYDAHLAYGIYKHAFSCLEELSSVPSEFEEEMLLRGIAVAFFDINPKNLLVRIEELP